MQRMGYIRNLRRPGSIQDSREMLILNEPKDTKTTILWNDLTVTVPGKQRFLQNTIWSKFRKRSFVESVTILKGVTGQATTGSLIAVMGPSGAGKTTFLATLGGRIVPTRGSVKINGETSSRENLAKISNYLPQTDALPTTLTVEEHLIFSYALKTDISKVRRRLLSMKLLMELGLADCRDVLIAKLSGGQRKRLSLASELITEPTILFLDEPTTGLDTFSAMQVVQALRNIMISFETMVFCIIHQPGMDIYNLFTHVLLMSDGRVGYFGTLQNATKFFLSLDYKCPVGFDEIEYYTKLLSPRHLEVSTKNRNFEADTPTELLDKICGAFSRSSLSRIPEITYDRVLEIEPRRKIGCFRQFSWLMWRIWKQSQRDVFHDWISWLSYFLSMAVVGIFYTGINPRTQEGVQNARGALYMMSSEISFTVAYSVIYEFPGQLLIFLRENNVYDSGPYYVASFLGLVPKAVLKALMFTTVMYLILVSELDLLNFTVYCLTTSTAALCSIAYGLMFSSWIEDIDVATSIMVPIDMMFLLTAGMFYNLRSLPTYLTYFKYFSIFFYLNEAVSIIYWSRVDDIDCQTSTDLPCLKSGEQVLSEYGFEETNFIWDLGGLIILTITMGLAGYFGLRRRRKIQTIL